MTCDRLAQKTLTSTIDQELLLGPSDSDLFEVDQQTTQALESSPSPNIQLFQQPRLRSAFFPALLALNLRQLYYPAFTSQHLQGKIPPWVFERCPDTTLWPARDPGATQLDQPSASHISKWDVFQLFTDLQQNTTLPLRASEYFWVSSTTSMATPMMSRCIPWHEKPSLPHHPCQRARAYQTLFKLPLFLSHLILLLFSVMILKQPEHMYPSIPASFPLLLLLPFHLLWPPQLLPPRHQPSPHRPHSRQRSMGVPSANTHRFFLFPPSPLPRQEDGLQ